MTVVGVSIERIVIGIYATMRKSMRYNMKNKFPGNFIMWKKNDDATYLRVLEYLTHRRINQTAEELLSLKKSLNAIQIELKKQKVTSFSWSK